LTKGRSPSGLFLALIGYLARMSFLFDELKRRKDW
jgi:hypothetical protein